MQDARACPGWPAAVAPVPESPGPQTMNPSELDLDFARGVLASEAAALACLADRVDDGFAQAVRMIHDCTGQLIVTGVGKAGLVGGKISATLASTGTPSLLLHPTEALHGDLGRLRAGDVVLALSHSGSTQEILMLLDHLKRRSLPVIALTGERGSPLGSDADVCICYGPVEEACNLKLAPSVSTTCMLALGDALALTVMRMRGFTAEEFAASHPAGSLGLTFVRVEKAMSFRGDRLSVASDRLAVREVLAAAERIPRRAGALLLTDGDGRLSGILTDADLRRRLLSDEAPSLLSRPASEVMVRRPKSVRVGAMCSEALAIMREYRIAELPVLDADGRPVGLIDLKDLVGMRGGAVQ